MRLTIFNHQFYYRMGLLLLTLVILGFGSNAVIHNRYPMNFPVLFHVHAACYLAWFTLLISQTRLISRQNYAMHRNLGVISILIVVTMLVTGFFMAANSYYGGVSPVEVMSLHQFMSLPFLDLMSIILFYTIAMMNRTIPLTHKHAILIMSIVIMEPALARLSMAIGLPPLVLLFHFSLVSLVILHDRKVHQKVHWVTWLGLVYLIARLIFIFTVAKTEQWASLIDGLFQ